MKAIIMNLGDAFNHIAEAQNRALFTKLLQQLVDHIRPYNALLKHPIELIMDDVGEEGGEGGEPYCDVDISFIDDPADVLSALYRITLRPAVCDLGGCVTSMSALESMLAEKNMGHLLTNTSTRETGTLGKWMHETRSSIASSDLMRVMPYYLSCVLAAYGQELLITPGVNQTVTLKQNL